MFRKCLGSIPLNSDITIGKINQKKSCVNQIYAKKYQENSTGNPQNSHNKLILVIFFTENGKMNITFGMLIHIFKQD